MGETRINYATKPVRSNLQICQNACIECADWLPQRYTTGNVIAGGRTVSVLAADLGKACKLLCGLQSCQKLYHLHVMKYNLHKSSHSVYSIYLHIYFVTKKRRNAISDEMAVRMREVVANICTKNKSELAEFGAEKNHVHLILDLHPDNNISQFIGSLKSATSRMVRKEFAEEYYHWYPKDQVFWGRQKFAVSCGGAPLEIVKQYVSNHPQGSLSSIP